MEDKNQNTENLPAVIRPATPAKLLTHPTNTNSLNRSRVTQRTFNGLIQYNLKTDDLGKHADIYA